MNKIEVCLSPELTHLYDLEGKIAIAVDIFRATSTMITGLSTGVASVTPVEDLEKCRQMKDRGYIIAGERNAQTAEGFQLGNSPLSYFKEDFSGQKVAMTTTNGTRALEMVKNKAEQVLIGAFLNLEATIKYLQLQKRNIFILCAGWKSRVNLEDSIYAGALVTQLEATHQPDCDAAVAMRDLWIANRSSLKSFLRQASHTQRLLNKDLETDINHCLSLNKYSFVAKLVGDEILAIQ